MRFLYCSASLALYALLLAGCETPASPCDPVAIAGAPACQSLQCTGFLADCKNGAADGCETDTATDLNNCGGCGLRCPTPANGEASCVAGVCGVSTCGTRYKDCNASAADGCEIDSLRDVNNCGACGRVCQGSTNAAGVCILGQCKLACQAAYLDCNGDPADGCETNGASDLANCGNCGNACTAVGATTPACSAGSCITTMCSGTNRTCKAGPIDSCEINTATDVANCGSCGKQCAAVANGTPGCTASNCGIASCNPNYSDCDSAIANGCEVNTTTDRNNCSACGKVCPTPTNASAACVASTCGLGSCNPGFADCDKALANGCEINTNTDINNCGMCGKVCGATETCIAGTCVSSCRIVAGVRWCYDPNNCGQACNQVCANLGLPFTIDDATWLAAQDTDAECQAIHDAFGLGGPISVGSYTYACAENSGPHTSPGGLSGTFFCSNYSGCPANHRTNMDGLGVACGASSFRSVCPCQ